MMQNLESGVSKIINLLFIIFVLSWLAAGLVKTLFFPKDINYLENRPANKVTAFSVSAYLGSNFQESMENALSDQMLFAQRMKKAYNQADSYLLQQMLRPVILAYRDRYIPCHGIYVFQEEYLLYPLSRLWPGDTRYDANLHSYNAGFAANPGVDFYLYYIETDLDMDFETGERSGIYELIKENLELPEDHIGRLTVGDFEDYSRYFLKTDHHWCYRGAYRSYVDILQMLAPDETPLRPQETVTLGTSSGSKAAGMGIYSFEEDFAAYRFAFPDMIVTINGQPAADYGSQSVWFQRADEGRWATIADGLRYGVFYGGDSGEVVFDTGRTDRENLLILGDSYDNAIIKLLAAHFSHTYAVDQRYYEAENGVPFDLSDYIKEHNITKVLVVGYAVSFQMAEFAWRED